jgi:hypothetical protein
MVFQLRVMALALSAGLLGTAAMVLLLISSR